MKYKVSLSMRKQFNAAVLVEASSEDEAMDRAECMDESAIEWEEYRVEQHSYGRHSSGTFVAQQAEGQEPDPDMIDEDEA